MSDPDVRAELFDRIRRSRTIPELEANRDAVAEHLRAHPDDVALAMEVESVAMTLDAYRSGLALPPEIGSPVAGQEGTRIADSTTFLSWRGTVARIVRDAAGMSIAVWRSSDRKWIDFPAILGDLTGLGGDGPVPIITRDAARAIIGGIPPALDAPDPAGFELDCDPPEGHYRDEEVATAELASEVGISLPPHCSRCGYPCCGAESTHIEHGGVAWMRPGAEIDAWLANRVEGTIAEPT